MKRIISIDIFRAITMFLMIFVNDLWTLFEVPEWLEHASADADRLGFSDVVFPVFLFIVGLSIPFAINNRKSKGDSNARILYHIIVRTIALLVMGVYMVNLENINAELMPINKNIWQLLMALAIFLVWNKYQHQEGKVTKKEKSLRIVGVLIFIFLAVVFKGGSAENPTLMKTYWWGILGLIGWAYLVGALIYLILGNRPWVIAGIWVLFILLNIQEFVSIPGISGIRLVVSASVYASTLGGMVASLLYLHFQDKKNTTSFLYGLGLLALIMILLGFALRPEWGISKIRATPSWTTICLGISFGLFGLLYYLSDIRKWTGWAKFIGPAGTSTLTCYLIPYFHYALLSMSAIYLPVALRTGGVGIIKSLLYAFLVIQLTGLLGKMNIRLKI